MIAAAMPIFTVFIAWPVLGERASIMDALNLVLVFTGIALIVRPPFLFGGQSASSGEGEEADFQHFFAAAMVVLSAVFTSAVYIFLRLLQGT